MSKRIQVTAGVIFSFLIAIPLFAADPTADLLSAQTVKDFIRLSKPLPGEDSVSGGVDSFDDTHLHSIAGETFAASRQISILVANFNPLTQVWTVNGKTSADPNFAAIKAFLDDLKPLQDTFKTDKTQGTNTVADEPPPSPDPCVRLRKLIADANNALSEPSLTAKGLQKIVEKATGYQGVTDARSDLQDVIDKIDENNKTARKTLDTIRKEFGTQKSQSPAKTCSSIDSTILVDYIDITGKAERVIAGREALSRSIADLIKTSLDPYMKSERWRGPALKDLLSTTVTPTFEKQVTVTASFKSKSVELADNDNSITVKTADSGASADFIVRRDSFWVPERAAAVIYNRLTYPNYGTKQDKATGGFTVQRTDDTRPVSGAVMLNLIPRFRRSSAVYPMFQIGVTSAKDYPGLVAGLGLRFTNPVAFSISFGGMVTRYKDLDKNLHVNDPVSGTDEINKHLEYRTSPIVPYAAIQMKF